MGGVLFHLHGVPTLLHLLGEGTTEDELHRRWTLSTSVASFETGKMSFDDFIEAVVEELSFQINPKEFAAVPDVPEARDDGGSATHY